MVVLINMAMKKIMISIPTEMVAVLEKDRRERYLETIPETIRVILSEYVRRKVHPNGKGDKKG
jgi:metal-responsive CopG/Arc/MetJ family transcriptional regulator